MNRNADRDRLDAAIKQGNQNVDEFEPEAEDSFSLSRQPQQEPRAAVPLWHGTLHTCTHWTPGDTHACDCPLQQDHGARDLP